MKVKRLRWRTCGAGGKHKRKTQKMREGMRKDVHVTAGMNEREDGESEGRRGPKKRRKVHVTGREGWEGEEEEERRMSPREQ